MTGSQEPIRAYDERGREVLFDRVTWRHDILPHNLQKSWNDAEGLYQLILDSVRDGFSEDVLEAASHLDEIDPMPERAACIHAIVLIDLKLYDQAERRLMAFISQFGETGVVLTNLAKTFSFRGDEAEARRLLRRALSLDPNQDNALDWWEALHHQEGGEEGARAALEEIASYPQSWRAKLGLARIHLKEGDPQGALALYREVLAVSKSPDAFHQISGDLGQAGYLGEMIDLIAPLYDLDRHGIACGLNLVRAYAALGGIEPGRTLWRRIKALNLPGFDQVLAELEQLLLKPISLTEAPKEPSAPFSITMPNVEGPIWTRGLQNAAWLMEGRQTGIRLQILPLTIAPPEKPMEAQAQIEDDAGRLSRAIPLFLAETLCFGTDARVATGFPYMKDKGPVVTPQPWPLPELLPGFGKGGDAWLVLTGRMPAGQGFAARLEVDIHDGASGQLLTTVKQVARNGADQAALSLAGKVEDALLDTGLVAKLAPPGWFAPPEESRQKDWLVSLGQLLAQQFALNRLLPAELLWNEHGIFETHFWLAESCPDWQLPALLAMNSVLAGIDYGSPVVNRYKPSLEKLLARHDGSKDPVDRLSPLAWMKLGNQEAFKKARGRLTADAGPAYRQWLEQLEGG